jgi:hypothetical protein
MATPTSTTSTNIAFALVSGQSLQLTWPADHTGWTLQVQTNAMASGLGTNWQNVAGSAGTNQMVMPVNPASGSVFYRLINQ